MTRARSRPRHVSGRMNKSETEYAAILQERQDAGELKKFRFEDTTLRLTLGDGKQVRYTPDFRVMENDDTITFVDVKPAWFSKQAQRVILQPEEDAKIKIRVAADVFPEYRFRAVGKRPKKYGGGWIEEDVG